MAKQLVSETKKVMAGDAIVKEGTWAYFAYILKEGNARVVKKIDGEDVQIGKVRSGELFGDMALIRGGERTASVIAESNAVVEMINKETFLEFLKQLPQDVQIKLHELVNDLTHLSDLYANAELLFEHIEKARTKVIDVSAFEMEIGKMPELMRIVTLSMAQRLNVAIEGLAKLMDELERTVKAVDSLSPAMVRK